MKNRIVDSGSLLSYREKTSQVPVESPENVEMGGKILSIRLCYAPVWKTILRYISYVCTGFIMYLINLWIPSLFVAMTYSDANLNTATSVVVYGADKNLEIEPLVREKTSEKTFKVFFYRLFKYYYDEEHGCFKPAQFKIDGYTFSEIHEKFGEGLDERVVCDNATFYGKNLTDIPKKSCLSLLIQEILSPFYVFQVYSVIVWAYDDYSVYAGIIMIFSGVSITITLYETIQTRSKLRKMSYYEIALNVYRKVDGQPKKIKINSSELVPGDVIEIPEGALMPCDVILLNGSCIMNESMLTGESIPVVKNSLPYSKNKYNPGEDKQYTLYAGTKCIQSRFYSGRAVVGLVTLTGFTTVKGELIRTMLFPKPTDFKFYSDSFKFISILGVMAIAGFIIDLPSWLNSGEDDLAEMIIIKASEIVTVTVPPALPTCMQIGISVALSRLKKKQIYCISPNKINETGRVNVMCFDKTGTLTEDGLDLLGVRPVFLDKNTNKLNFTKIVTDVRTLTSRSDKEANMSEIMNYKKAENSRRRSIYHKYGLTPSEQLLEIMAVCHSLTRVNGEMIGDPLDLKMFESTQWTFEENDQQKYDSFLLALVKSPPQPELFGQENTNVTEVGIIRRFEFSSKLQRMSVVVKNLQESGFKVHIKGSPEKIRELCRPESVPNKFHQTLEKYTENGYRVLACATKSIGLNYKAIMSANREDIENDFTFIGFLIMENRLKPITTQIIDCLHSAEIRTIMVTGDNVLTAISVARQCHIVGHFQRIFLGDLSEQQVDGKNVIVWKDFNYSQRKLNNELEPEDANELSSVVRASYASSGKRRHTFALKDHLSSSDAGDHNKINVRERFNSHHSNHVKLSSSNISSDFPLQSQVKLLHETTNGGVPHDDAPFFNMQIQDDYCIAVTGKAFSMILHEAEVNNNLQYKRIMQKLLKKCVVFARMHPDEKALMIKHLMTNPKNIVGMCGDGANDVGALKTANVGVSLSEAEASIAAPFTSNIQDISCIPTLLREGRAGLATSYQAFKYMALYSIIQFTTVTILYFELIELTNWAYYHIDIFIILSLSATMAMSESYDILTKFKPTGRLVSVHILSSVIPQGLIQIFFQLGTYMIMKFQPWYGETTPSNFESQLANKENTTLYILTIYQYCMTAFAFIIGKPFRKPFYTNFWFSGSFIILMLLNLVATYNPFNFQFIYSDDFSAESQDFPYYWRNWLMGIAVINSLVTLIWEFAAVKSISDKWKQHREEKERMLDARASFYQAPAAHQEIIVQEA